MYAATATVMFLGMNLSQDEQAGQSTRRDCLVLIPGTLCDASLFKRQVRVLRQRWQVIVLDYQHLTDVKAWPTQTLRTLPAQFYLAGFSLGGLWILELLRRAPQRVLGIALIASNAEGGTRRSELRSASLWRLWRLAGAQSVARQVLPDYFHCRAVRDKQAARLSDMARSTPSRAARAEFEWAARRPSGLELISAFDKPLLIVSGARDKVCPRRFQQRMVNAQPEADWAELPRCGHFIPLEKPAALTALLSRWLTNAPTKQTERRPS